MMREDQPGTPNALLIFANKQERNEQSTFPPAESASNGGVYVDDVSGAGAWVRHVRDPSPGWCRRSRVHLALNAAGDANADRSGRSARELDRDRVDGASHLRPGATLTSTEVDQLLVIVDCAVNVSLPRP
jgi:hypothetical protein